MTIPSLRGRPPRAAGAEGASTPQSQPSLAELGELKRALATSRQQLQAAQRQCERLAKTNACLQQQLMRLTEQCAQALHFAHHDPLTGLPNRSLLLDRLKQTLAQSARQLKQVALLFIDLDKFKSVNDRLGHAAGDQLLQQVAERLAACTRRGDTVCRYGGDEFVIMLPEIDGQDTAAAVTEKIRTHLAAPYAVDGQAVAITASIGTALYRADGQTCSDLIQQADQAMYLAKARGSIPTGFLPALQD